MPENKVTTLKRPTEASTLVVAHRITFPRGTQVAGAEATFLVEYEEDVFRKNVREAFDLALLKAEQKYVEEFGEPVDWTLAVVVTQHKEYSVEVHIYVEA